MKQLKVIAQFIIGCVFIVGHFFILTTVLSQWLGVVVFGVTMGAFSAHMEAKKNAAKGDSK